MSNTWDQRQFDRALNACIQVSRRSAANVINAHALYIAFSAQNFTPKADKMAIGRSLSELIYDFKATKKGSRRTLKTKTVYTGAGGATAQAPIVALMINKKRGEHGKPGLYGPDMAAAVRTFIAGRQRTVAFLKSGWSPAIKLLKSKVPYKFRGAAKEKEIVKFMGQAKGRATAAVESEKPTAMIENFVGMAGPGGNHHNAGLVKYGQPAFERAFRTETASMIEHLKKELDETAFAEFNRQAA
jgi:hypothetical protein